VRRGRGSDGRHAAASAGAAGAIGFHADEPLQAVGIVVRSEAQVAPGRDEVLRVRAGRARARTDAPGMALTGQTASKSRRRRPQPRSSRGPPETRRSLVSFR
jgi:hypothetical protein